MRSMVLPNKQNIVIGRSKEDTAKYGTKGTVLLGKHYIEMDDKYVIHDDVFLDVSGAHVVFVCGKRGGGKSYTMGVIAEGFSLLEPEIKDNLAIIMLDTMGIYWSMSHPNKKEKDLLEPYGIEPRGIKVRIFTPEKFYYEYKKKGIPTDDPFTLDPSTLNADDWCAAFHLEKYSPEGLLISKITTELHEKVKKFTLDDLTKAVKEDKETDRETQSAVVSMFETAKGWGVFSDHATPLEELAKGGQITVLDVSCYATMPGGWDVKALVIGIVAQHLFVHRMKIRKDEEFDDIKYREQYFANASGVSLKKKMPLVWLVIDEAHEFLPKDGIVASTQPLVTIMREGRQPGICLIMASQQPGKIHTDVMTQSDTVIAHRITARMDVEALSLLAQSYMKEGLSRAMNFLPRVKGAAVVFDDANEKLYQIRVRPRFTWHGGSSPSALTDD
jgi:uncharacterized protein